MRFRIVGGLLVVFASLAVWASPAAAIVTNTPGGRVSYLPLNEAALAGSGANSLSVPTGSPPLEYHGGPVMHSQTSYAVFWAPSGYSFPAGYESAVIGFLKNVAADSGKGTNVYSLSAQYSDGIGHAAYSETYGGAISDTTAFPTSGTCAPYNGFHGETFSACITDAKLEAEVEAVASSHSLQEGLGAEYYMVLPPHAGSCFSTGGECFDEDFCAYHSFTAGSETVYSNISYSPSDPSGCGVGEYPNGHANGNVDDTASSLSHEANESVTDPTLEAWFDEEGFENGDECRNTPCEEDYGPPLGGSAGALFNQAIASGHYYLQQEWSNDIDDCAQRVDLPTPSISGPSQLATGQTAQFGGGGSAPGSGGISSYSWDFGDGQTASGANVSHAFASPGTYTVTLTLKDDGGFSSSTTREISVTTPAVVVPPVVTIIPGDAGGTPPSPAPPIQPAKCRKGFHRVNRNGRHVCVRVRHHHRKRR